MSLILSVIARAPDPAYISGMRQGPPEENLACAAVQGLSRALILRCIEGLEKGALDNEGLPGLAVNSVSVPEAAR